MRDGGEKQQEGKNWSSTLTENEVVESLTLGKSGGGFLPRHKLERAHTKFLVIESLVDFVRRLLNKNITAVILRRGLT